MIVLLCNPHDMILESSLFFISYHLYQLFTCVYQRRRHIEDAFFFLIFVIGQIMINLTPCNSINLETQRWEFMAISGEKIFDCRIFRRYWIINFFSGLF